jgi:hypothetical protein
MIPIFPSPGFCECQPNCSIPILPKVSSQIAEDSYYSFITSSYFPFSLLHRGIHTGTQGQCSGAIVLMCSTLDTQFWFSLSSNIQFCPQKLNKLAQNAPCHSHPQQPMYLLSLVAPHHTSHRSLHCLHTHSIAKFTLCAPFTKSIHRLEPAKTKIKSIHTPS